MTDLLVFITVTIILIRYY